METIHDKIAEALISLYKDGYYDAIDNACDFLRKEFFQKGSEDFSVDIASRSYCEVQHLIDGFREEMKNRYNIKHNT